MGEGNRGAQLSCAQSLTLCGDVLPDFAEVFTHRMYGIKRFVQGRAFRKAGNFLCGVTQTQTIDGTARSQQINPRGTKIRDHGVNFGGVFTA